MITKSSLVMEVGCPRIDSTCFFDIPSSTSSTFAFVMRLPGLHETTKASAATSKSREVREDTQVHKGWRANLQAIRYAATSAVDIKAQLALWIFRCEVNLAWRSVESLRNHNKMMD